MLFNFSRQSASDTPDLRLDVLQRKSGWVVPKPKEKLKRKLTEQAEESFTSLSDAAKLVKSALCSHLPDDVVKAKHKKALPHMKTFEAGVLFLDISGKPYLHTYAPLISFHCKYMYQSLSYLNLGSDPFLFGVCI